MPQRPRPRIQSVLFDLMICALLGVALYFDHASLSAGSAANGAVMAAALIVRRRWPLSVFAVTALGGLVQVLFFGTEAPRPYDVAIQIAMYSVVKYGRRRWEGWAAAGVVAIGITIESVTYPDNWRNIAFVYTAGSAAVWLTAYVLRNRRTYLRSLEERAATLEREREHLARIAVADERAAIARELHDVVAHSLAVMIVQADGGRYAFDHDPHQARVALETVAATGREALTDMRRLVGVLRGANGAEGEPTDDRRTGIGQLNTFAERARSAGVRVDLSVSVADADLPPAVGLTAVRVVQEALTNTLRHAGPGARAQVRVCLDDDMLVVSCVDDGGQRPAVPSTSDGVGHGLIGMRERVSVHAGVLEAGRFDGGWRVTAQIPLARAGSA